jgi:hypothetical protein
MALVAILLPVVAYSQVARRLTSVSHPLSEFRDCGLSLETAHPEIHIYMPYHELLSHSYFYYLRNVGPWVESEGLRIDELRARIAGSARPAFHVLLATDYYSLTRDTPANASGADAESQVPGGVSFGQDIVILAPGALSRCIDRAVAAGGEGVPGIPSAGTRE